MRGGSSEEEERSRSSRGMNLSWSSGVAESRRGDIRATRRGGAAKGGGEQREEQEQ